MEADWKKFLKRPEWVLICNTKLRLMTDTPSNATSQSLFLLPFYLFIFFFLASVGLAGLFRGLEGCFVQTGINYKWLCQKEERRRPWHRWRAKTSTVGRVEFFFKKHIRLNEATLGSFRLSQRFTSLKWKSLQTAVRNPNKYPSQSATFSILLPS